MSQEQETSAGNGGSITLEEAQELVMYLEAGMQEEADRKFMSIVRARKPNVFVEVGNLTRDLHEAIRNFAEDPRLRDIADIEIPNASERLRYIITMTDKAATRTLDAVDNCKPLANELIAAIEDILPLWNRLMHRDIDRYEFVSLCHQVDQLLNSTKEHAYTLSHQLDEILMAQDYQDLTGQMIQKVISLVTEVEGHLVKFLVTFSQISGIQPVPAEERDKQPSIEAAGPALESQKQTKEVVSSQDDVDDLLASLGF